MKIVLFIMTTLVLSSCISVPDNEYDVERDEFDDPSEEERFFDDFSLRGNPDFDPDQLSDMTRLWYDRLWFAIRNPRQYQNTTELAQGASLYTYARPLNSYITTLLQVFRITGDLELLDEVDRVMEIMRGQLVDHWIDENGRVIPAPTDHKRWLWLRSGNYYGKDHHVMDNLLAHASVAAAAWALENNRDLTSPSGVDYGERADFWADYLQNHFEAKWRSGITWDDAGMQNPHYELGQGGRRLIYRFANHPTTIRPDSDPGFIVRYNGHTHTHGIRFYHYYDKILESQGRSNYDGSPYDGRYGEFARKQTEQAFDTPRIEGSQTGGIYYVDTPMGASLIWPSGLPFGWSNIGHRALATVYQRYVISAANDLHLDRAYRWRDEDIMERLAVNLAFFILDTPSIHDRNRPFARDNVGEQEGWPIPPQTDYRRREYGRIFSIAPAGMTLAYSPNDEVYERILEIMMEIYDDEETDPNRPRRIFIPAAMVLTSALNE